MIHLCPNIPFFIARINRRSPIYRCELGLQVVHVQSDAPDWPGGTGMWVYLYGCSHQHQVCNYPVGILSPKWSDDQWEGPRLHWSVVTILTGHNLLGQPVTTDRGQIPERTTNNCQKLKLSSTLHDNIFITVQHMRL